MDGAVFKFTKLRVTPSPSLLIMPILASVDEVFVGTIKRPLNLPLMSAEPMVSFSSLLMYKYFGGNKWP